MCVVWLWWVMLSASKMNKFTLESRFPPAWIKYVPGWLWTTVSKEHMSGLDVVDALNIRPIEILI